MRQRPACKSPNRFIRVLGALAVTVVASSARSEDPGSPQARLAAVLARGNDQRINTERGAIRIIGFAKDKAKTGAIFFIHGDPEWHRIGAFSETLRDEETKVLANHLIWLHDIAMRGRYATYFVARTGVFGSDGETNEFRREDSYLSIGRAIDTVIKRDRINTTAIAGHSGGAAVALYHAIALPSAAVNCYVLASGVYNLGAMAEFVRVRKQPGTDVTRIDRTKLGGIAFTPMPTEMATKLKYFEPLFHIGEMPAVAERSIIAVSHRHDLTAPFFASDDLVARLNGLGHRAQLITAEAKPPTYHYTYDTAVTAATRCMDRGKRG